MNIHPAFVHFPIAFLILYAIIEVLPLQAWLPRVPWAPIRNFLLYVGTLALVPALVTGGIAADIVGETDLIEFHERAASAVFFGFFITSMLSLYGQWKGRSKTIKWALKVLATLGFFGILIVGSLGAAIVYGPDVDLVVRFIYDLFF